ncbi:hypothetical protein [Chromobacterium haemolyticum]
MGAAEVCSFLTHLAIEGLVSASTQNQECLRFCSSIVMC